jgi:flagellar motor protein MotB
MRRGNSLDFTHSMADLMAGVAVTFLLLAAIFMVQVARSRAAEAARAQAAVKKLEHITDTDEKAISTLLALRDSLRDDSDLQGAVELQYDKQRDPFLLTIVLDRDRLRFDAGDCAIQEAVRGAMSSSFKALFQGVCRTADSGLIQSITLEGHTDNHPFFPGDRRCGIEPARRHGCDDGSREARCAALGFENNVRLSAARAQNVFFEMRQLLGNEPSIARCLETKFVIAGRGPVEPLDGRSWQDVRSEAHNERNRRVVIKVRATARAAVTP